ncbi:MAG: rhomboid family intramembrane serine protease [Bacteroidota bacterium]
MADADSPLFRFQLWRAGLPPALRILLTVNLAVFAVVLPFAILAAFGLTLPYRLLEFLALPADPATALFRPWTPFTYGFVNLIGGPGAIWGIISFAFAMYWLNWLGRDYEENHGGYRLFGLYLGSALFGAAVALALSSFVPPRPFPYSGAWGPATAVLVAAATLNPNRGIGLFLLGVVSLKWIAIGFIVLSLLNPDATFLGAALFGFFFAKAQQADIDLAAWARPLFDRRPARRTETAPRRSPFARATPTPRGRSGSSGGSKSKRSSSRGGTRDIDAILDKILEQGYESLTPEEREILDQASRD